MFGCSGTMLRKTHSELDSICQTTTDGSLMEREVLYPVWVCTTPHRTFCVGHGSTHQHKQELGRVRATMELCWMAIFLLCLWALHTQRYLRTYPVLQLETAEWQMVLKKLYNRISPFRGEKKCSFHLFLVKKKPNQRTNKPETKTHQTKIPQQQITKVQNPTTKPKRQKPNTSQYNSRHTARIPGKL